MGPKCVIWTLFVWMPFLCTCLLPSLADVSRLTPIMIPCHGKPGKNLKLNLLMRHNSQSNTPSSWLTGQCSFLRLICSATDHSHQQYSVLYNLQCQSSKSKQSNKKKKHCSQGHAGEVGSWTLRAFTHPTCYIWHIFLRVLWISATDLWHSLPQHSCLPSQKW